MASPIEGCKWPGCEGIPAQTGEWRVFCWKHWAQIKPADSGELFDSTSRERSAAIFERIIEELWAEVPY